MEKILPYRRKVNYYETDKMGIVHHSNYIRFFEEARSDLIEQAGMAYSEIEAAGVMMPVLSVECRCLRPLHYDEEFYVSVTVERFTGTRLILNYQLFSSVTGMLCTEGKSSHCFTDFNLKPLRTKHSHPQIFSLFSELCSGNE